MVEYRQLRKQVNVKEIAMNTYEFNIGAKFEAQTTIAKHSIEITDVKVFYVDGISVYIYFKIISTMDYGKVIEQERCKTAEEFAEMLNNENAKQILE